MFKCFSWLLCRVTTLSSPQCPLFTECVSVAIISARARFGCRSHSVSHGRREREGEKRRGTFPRGEKRSASNCCSALSLSVFPLLLLSFSVVSTLPATDRWISSTNSSHVDCLAAWIQLSPSSSGSLSRPLTLSDEMWREREGKQRWLLMAKKNQVAERGGKATRKNEGKD